VTQNGLPFQEDRKRMPNNCFRNLRDSQPEEL